MIWIWPWPSVFFKQWSCPVVHPQWWNSTSHCAHQGDVGICRDTYPIFRHSLQKNNKPYKFRLWKKWLIYIYNICCFKINYFRISRFPNHPFIAGIFLHKPSILGYRHDYATPIYDTIWLFNSLPWKITIFKFGKPSISIRAIYTMANC